MKSPSATGDPQFYVTSIRAGNRRILAKTITLIESSLPAHQELARVVVDRLLAYTGKGVRLGITGVQGVGKSTFIESLGMMLVQKGHRLAVLAVDPSSSRSGGSITWRIRRAWKSSLRKSRRLSGPLPPEAPWEGLPGKQRDPSHLRSGRF